MNRPRLSVAISRGKSIIIVSMVLGLALAALVTARSDNVYESSALLETGVGGQVPARRTFDQQQAAEALARGYATTLDSPGFLARIAPEVAGGSLSAGELGSRVDASLVSETSLVSLKATGDSPEAARDLVTEVAAAFTETLRTDARAQMEAQRADLRERIAALDAEIARGDGSPGPLSDARAGLTKQLADAIASASTVGIALTSPPDTPTSPIEPRPVLNAVAGVLLGALVGVALSWLWLVWTGGAPLRSLRLRGGSGGDTRSAKRRRRRPARSPDDPSPREPASSAGEQDGGGPAESPVAQEADAEKDEAEGAPEPAPRRGSAPAPATGGAKADDEERASTAARS